MTPTHLLPANATTLEQSLSLASDSLARLALTADAIREFKIEPADPVLPWLIWEYGLGELLPYLPDPRQAILEGIRWQSLRGTPRALQMALGWIGADEVFVEPEVPGVHFSEFQIDPGFVLDDDRRIGDLIAIAQLSAPARSRLSRIYHGWDLRRFLLDESYLGDALLSDHSGVFWQDGATKLSFGRGHSVPLPPWAIDLALLREAARFAWVQLPDRFLLDFAHLGDPGYTPNPRLAHSRLMTLANAAGVPQPVGVLPERRFCKAMIVLSDSTALGDTNVNLPRFVWQERGTPLGLGDGVLSASDHRLRRIEVLERFDVDHRRTASIPQATLHSARQSRRLHRVPAQAYSPLGLLRLGQETRRFDQAVLHRLHEFATRERQVWGRLPWPAARWRDLFRDPPELGRAALTPVRAFCRAMVVLSDSTPLGDTNANLPKAVWQEQGIAPALGEGRGLSGDYRRQRIAVLIRSEGTHPIALEMPAVGWASSRAACVTHPISARADAALGLLCLGEALPCRDAIGRAMASHGYVVPWQGQGWSGVTWPTSSWRQTRELIGSRHTSH